MLKVLPGPLMSNDFPFIKAKKNEILLNKFGEKRLEFDELCLNLFIRLGRGWTKGLSLPRI